MGREKPCFTCPAQQMQFLAPFHVLTDLVHNLLREKNPDVCVLLHPSVMESGRTLTLAEKGDDPPEVIVAAEGFRIVATMNPGGDFGKKELSPALSNRFTQIWVPQIEDAEELKSIVESRLAGEFCLCHELRFRLLCTHP